jgi:hypothetical protein
MRALQGWSQHVLVLSVAAPSGCYSNQQQHAGVQIMHSRELPPPLSPPALLQVNPPPPCADRCVRRGAMVQFNWQLLLVGLWCGGGNTGCRRHAQHLQQLMRGAAGGRQRVIMYSRKQWGHITVEAPWVDCGSVRRNHGQCDFAAPGAYRRQGSSPCGSQQAALRLVLAAAPVQWPAAKCAEL